MKPSVLLFLTEHMYIIKQHHFYFYFILEQKAVPVSCVKTHLDERKKKEVETLMTKLIGHNGTKKKYTQTNLPAPPTGPDESTFALPHLKDCFPLHPPGDSAVRFSPLPSTDERLCSISTLITQRNVL